MDGYNDEVAILIAQTGPLNGQQWAIRKALVVGRDESCDIVIQDRQVSRQHARFTADRGGIYLEDLDSKNGTYHNGALIHARVLLRDSDAIQVAYAQSFVFLSSDATLPLGAGPSGKPVETGSKAAPMTSSSASVLPGTQSAVTRLRLDKRSHQVWVRAPKTGEAAAQTKEVEVLPPLSHSQYLLLEMMYDQAGDIVSREAMIKRVWGQDQSLDISEQALDALIRRLRERLASVDPHHDYIKTVRGHGLRLDNPPIP